MSKLIVRTCVVCKKPLGTTAIAGKYYHPACFRKVKAKLVLGKDRK